MSAEGSSQPRVAETTRRERIPLGILYMVSATILFAGNSAISKWLVDKYPVGEVIFTRSLVGLIVCSIIILPQTGLAVFHTQRLGDHIKRGISQSASQTCIVIAFLYMPLAGAVAITFSAPLFATLLSVLFLREPVGFARGAALVVGFLGVVLVTNPGADTLQIGALFALGNAVLYATVTVAVRGMTVDGVHADAHHVSDGAADRFPRAAPAVRLHHSHLAGRRAHGVRRPHQRGRAISGGRGHYISRRPRRSRRSTISRWSGLSSSAS